MFDGLTARHDFEAPPERVWEAFTTPAQFAAWFGTAAVHVPIESVALDVRPGGAWRATMELPDETSVDWHGSYTEVVPPHRLCFTISDEPGDPAGLPVDVDIEPTPLGCRVRLRQHRGGFTDEQLAATEGGYRAFLEAMAAEIARDQRDAPIG